MSWLVRRMIKKFIENPDAFLIPIPFLIMGIVVLNYESFNYAGVDNLTIAVIAFVGYGIGVFFAICNYIRGGMILENLEER